MIPQPWFLSLNQNDVMDTLYEANVNIRIEA